MGFIQRLGTTYPILSYHDSRDVGIRSTHLVYPEYITCLDLGFRSSPFHSVLIQCSGIVILGIYNVRVQLHLYTVLSYHNLRDVGIRSTHLVYSRQSIICLDLALSLHECYFQCFQHINISGWYNALTFPGTFVPRFS